MLIINSISLNKDDSGFLKEKNAIIHIVHEKEITETNQQNLNQNIAGPKQNPVLILIHPKETGETKKKEGTACKCTIF